MPARRKVQKALKEIKSNPPKDVTVSLPDDKDCMKWHVVMIGPEDTPYSQGKYIMELNFTNNFPMHPPSTRMKTKIYHINVDKAGKICVGLLDDEWTAKSKVTEILERVYSLFSDPMPDSALNDEMCAQFISDREAYDKTAAEYNKQFAMPPDAIENNNDDEKEKELQKDKAQNNNNNNNNNNDQENNGNVNDKNDPNKKSIDDTNKNEKQVSDEWFCLFLFSLFV